MFRLISTTRPAIFSRQPRVIQSPRSYSQSFDRREKTLEDKSVRDHEKKKLIENLQLQLKIKEEQLQQAENKIGKATGKEHEDETPEKLVSFMEDELLELRKDVLKDIHSLEDMFSEITMRTQRLERRLKDDPAKK